MKLKLTTARPKASRTLTPAEYLEALVQLEQQREPNPSLFARLLAAFRRG